MIIAKFVRLPFVGLCFVAAFRAALPVAAAPLAAQVPLRVTLAGQVLGDGHLSLSIAIENSGGGAVSLPVRDEAQPCQLLVRNDDGRELGDHRTPATGKLEWKPGETKKFSALFPAATDPLYKKLPDGEYDVAAVLALEDLRVNDDLVQIDEDSQLQSALMHFRVGSGGPPDSNKLLGPEDAGKLPLAPQGPASDPGFHAGDLAPDFHMRDMNGQVRSLSDYRGGKALLLTFFPKCFTGGCANHLSSVRDVYKQLTAANVEVLAVSVDPADGPTGQKEFATRWSLPFPLIPDTNRELCLLYGAVTNPQDLASRMSFLIDKTGRIRWIDTHVNVRSHGADMLAKIHELAADGF